MSSLYAQYIQERLGKSIVENEKGFATYRFLPDGDCYIEDIFVNPDYRDQGVASDMADEIQRIAKTNNSKKLYGSVVPSTKGSTASLKVLLAYGFKLDSCANDFIMMVKEL